MTRQPPKPLAADRGAAPLRLRARDAEDLQAIAACLQDSLVPLAEIAYLKGEQRFIMIANRFRWEAAARHGPARIEPGAGDDARFEDSGDDPRTGPMFERVHCGVCFDRVRGVQVRGVNLRDKDRILNLLTLSVGPGAIFLVFSGGAEIHLGAAMIRCHMEDLGEPWPTRWQPSHPLEGEAADGSR